MLREREIIFTVLMTVEVLRILNDLSSRYTYRPCLQLACRNLESDVKSTIAHKLELRFQNKSTANYNKFNYA